MSKSQDPTIREIKYLISQKKKKELKGCKVHLQDPQVMKQYLRQHSHLVLQKGVLYRQVSPPMRIGMPYSY